MPRALGLCRAAACADHRPQGRNRPPRRAHADAALRHRRTIADHRLPRRGSGRARSAPPKSPCAATARCSSKRVVTVHTDIKFNVPIPHAGPNIVEIEASPLEGELTQVNNRAVVSIDGVRDKLRVLLVSGEPHAGERTWRNLLKSDASVDLVHFTILRPPEKQDGTPINELSLIAFPTRELFQQKIARIPAHHLRPLCPAGRAAADLFRQHREICARRRRRADRRRPGLRQPDQHLAHAARRHPAGRADRRSDRAPFQPQLTDAGTAPSGDARP